MTGVYILILLLSPCMECCRDVTCLRISLDREKTLEGSIKEPPWRIGIIVFKIAIS